MLDWYTPVSWCLQRSWAQGALRGWAWWTALAAAAAIAGSSLYLQQRVDRQVELENRQLANARAVAPHPTQPVAVEANNFARSLGKGTPVVQVVEELRRSCDRAGVVLASVQVRERTASHDQLGRAELVLTLRGSYVDSKRVLKDATDRFPKLTVQRLRMRRAQSPTDVETTATLSLWAAPFAPVRLDNAMVATP